MKLKITWPEGYYVPIIRFSEVPAGRHWLPRTIFSRCVGLAPKAESERTSWQHFIAKTQQGGTWWWLWVWRGPAVIPQDAEREKGKKPIQSSLNSGLKAIYHLSASVVKTHKQRPVSLEQSWGHTEATSAGLSYVGLGVQPNAVRSGTPQKQMH